MYSGKVGTKLATGLGTALAVERFQSGISGAFDTSEFTQLGLGVIIKDLVINGALDRIIKEMIADLESDVGADLINAIYQYPAYVLSFMASRLILSLPMNVKKNLKDGVIFMVVNVIVGEIFRNAKSYKKTQ